MSKKKTGTFTKKGSPERRKTAPPSQVHKKKKGAGSYDRKEKVEPIKEQLEIRKFIDCVLEKNYAEAYKYLNDVVESKLQTRIEQELSTPLF